MTLLPDFNQPRYNGGLFGSLTLPRYAWDEGGPFGNGRLYPYPQPPKWGEPGHEPWQRFPGPVDPTLPYPNPTSGQVNPREVFNPFGFSVPGGLAGRYMGMGNMSGLLLPGALGGLIGAGIQFFGGRRRK